MEAVMDPISTIAAGVEDEQYLFNGEVEKFLTFVLEGEEYGIEILKVREIIGIMAVTPVPQASTRLKGIINLRGKIIPVFDLRLIFGMPERARDSETCIIIVNVNASLIGIIVDTVSEVMDVKKDEVETSLDLDKKINTQFILGISNIKDQIRILIDIDRIFGNENLRF